MKCKNCGTDAKTDKLETTGTGESARWICPACAFHCEMSSEQQCSDCFHFFRDPKNEKQGQCRGTFPQVIIIVQQQNAAKMVDGKLINAGSRPVSGVRSIFPPILANDPGCSKYEPKEKNNVFDKAKLLG